MGGAGLPAPPFNAVAEGAQTALKEMFNAARFRTIAKLLAACQPGFEQDRFIRLATLDLESNSLLQRMRQGTVAMHATLPANYSRAIAVLSTLAPRITPNFVGLMLPDYIGLYGQGHFDESMSALHYLTRFSSGEFAIREFLKWDLPRTLKVMETWSRDPDEHVRRLASEGCRPRLPWSFQLPELIADPTPVTAILENLRADRSLYVRKSVANHLNDISKDHPGWMLDRLASWNLTDPHTQWIAKHAARSLIKAGHPRVFHLFGFTEKPAVKLSGFRLTPANLKLGGALTLNFRLSSMRDQPQKIAADYIVHYRKKSGKLAPKVFKLREITLAPFAVIEFNKRQSITDFTTRIHHAGRHEVEIMINGTVLGKQSFELTR